MPRPGENEGIAALGIMLGVLGIIAYIKLTLSGAGKKDASDGVKSIGLSFVQIISLLTTFPIAWPPIFTSLFQIGGAVTVLGQHMVNLKCMFPERSEAEVFYSSRVAWACFPPLMIVVCVMAWRGLILYFPRWYRARALQDAMSTRATTTARHPSGADLTRSRIDDDSRRHAASKDIRIRPRFVSDLARHVLEAFICVPDCLRRRVALEASNRSHRVLF